MIEFSYFNHFYDNKPQRCFMDSWGSFVTNLRATSDVTGYKPLAGESTENSTGLISPAIYKEDGMERNNNNVSGWDLAIMDIDDGINDIESVKKHFSFFNNIIYSSPNCTAEQLKIRVIIPLKSRCPSDKLRQLWFAMNEWCDGIIDKQTKDKSRLFYIAARYTNKGDRYLHIFHENQGMELDWETLIERYPSPPEKDLFKKSNPLKGLKRQIYLKTKKQPSFNITDKKCPFVTRDMMEEYMLTPAGGHHYAIYKFMLRCCYNANKIEYPIDLEELVDMARQLDDMDGGWYDDKKFYDSGQDALEYTNLL